MLQIIQDEESILQGNNEHQEDKHYKMKEWQAEAQTPEAEDDMTNANDTTPKVKPKDVNLNSPTHDPASKYLFISPKDYKPSSKALQYQAKLQTMTKMEEPPPGFTFSPEFITEEEEQTLIRLSRDFRWEQDVPTRQTVQFGFKYDYKTKAIVPGTPLIPELEWLRVKLIESKIFDGRVHECIVNERTSPNGFGAHIDNVSAFAGTVAILGTQSAVNCILWDEELQCYYEARSKRRSLMVMQDEARYSYCH